MDDAKFCVSQVRTLSARGEPPFSRQTSRSRIHRTAINTLAENVWRWVCQGVLVAAIAQLVGCGGGGGGAGGSTTPPAASTSPEISSQPASASVAAPTAANFSVVANGNPSPDYQWQKSVDAGGTWSDVSGATAASFTSAPTSLADSGALFRVVVRNSAGQVVSSAAALTVASASVPPTILAQPAGASVRVPAVATFAVGASGTPTPAYQWQVSVDSGASFTNVAGATAASYTTPATTVGDSGKQYRVVVTNTLGTVTSTAAALTATAGGAPSVLAGRAWAIGQALVTNNGVENSTFKAAIDDAGNVTVVYLSSVGGRTGWYATHGTPGASGQLPAWTPAVAIDGSIGAIAGGVLVVPASNGDAYVVWTASSACTALTSSTIGNCTYLKLSQFSARSNTWGASLTIDETPFANLYFTAKANGAGDIAILYQGWRQTAIRLEAVPTVAMRARGESAFRVQKLPINAPIGSPTRSLGMDDAGNIVVFAEAEQNATIDYVAYRGTVGGGLGNQEVIDTRLSKAHEEMDVTVGANGQIVAFFSESRPAGGLGFFSVTAPSFFAPFTLQDLNKPDFNNGTNIKRVAALDNGDALLFYGCTVSRWTGATGTWSAFVAQPPSYCGFREAMNSQGDYLRIVEENGLWGTYDAASNAMIQSLPLSFQGLPTTGPQYVFGVSAGVSGASASGDNYLLSKSGIGVLVTNWKEVLSTPAQPAGDGRPGVKTLWGVFFK